ncbi:hypothetical protein [Thaumasiovibrio subtropicus]|uniref:hypothetical protein n=1 Tax=Thaumasiovibrio subtropicus TaxID=1891207 RepID=UPI00131ABC3E|nr:hypothetical protein [Thaumasiovibrio subtropicus]
MQQYRPDMPLMEAVAYFDDHIKWMGWRSSQSKQFNPSSMRRLKDSVMSNPFLSDEEKSYCLVSLLQ